MACQLSPHTQCPNFTTDYHKNILYRDGRKKNIYIIKNKLIKIYIESVEIYNIYKYEEKLTTHMPARFSCSTVAFYLVHSCMYI